MPPPVLPSYRRQWCWCSIQGQGKRRVKSEYRARPCPLPPPTTVHGRRRVPPPSAPGRRRVRVRDLRAFLIPYRRRIRPNPCFSWRERKTTESYIVGYAPLMNRSPRALLQITSLYICPSRGFIASSSFLHIASPEESVAPPLVVLAQRL